MALCARNPRWLPLSTQTSNPSVGVDSQVMAQPYGSQAWLGFPQVAAGLDPWGSQNGGVVETLLIHQNGVVSLRIPPRSLVEQCYVQVRSK